VEAVADVCEVAASVVPPHSAIYRLANEVEAYGLHEYQVHRAREYVDQHADSIRRAYESIRSYVDRYTRGGGQIALGGRLLAPSPPARWEKALRT